MYTRMSYEDSKVIIRVELLLRRGAAGGGGGGGGRGDTAVPRKKCLAWGDNIS